MSALPTNGLNGEPNGALNGHAPAQRIGFDALLVDRNHLAEQKTRFERLHYHALSLLFDLYSCQLEESGQTARLLSLAEQCGFPNPGRALSRALSAAVLRAIERKDHPADLAQTLEAALLRMTPAAAPVTAG